MHGAGPVSRRAARRVASVTASRTGRRGRSTALAWARLAALKARWCRDGGRARAAMRRRGSPCRARTRRARCSAAAAASLRRRAARRAGTRLRTPAGSRAGARAA
eukprot:4235964-Prymnesium_polylepis.1